MVCYTNVWTEAVAIISLPQGKPPESATLIHKKAASEDTAT